LIAALVIGGTAGMMVFSSEEYALKKASRELEGMAKRARATAILKQTPYALEFSPGMVRLMPWAEAAGETVLITDALPTTDEDGHPPELAAAVYWELSLDNGMRTELRRWDSERWASIEEGGRELWRFDPNGLSEPLGVRLWLKQSTCEMKFHPLSAAIDQSEIDIR